jgi:hypothetical protein
MIKFLGMKTYLTGNPGGEARFSTHS